MGAPNPDVVGLVAQLALRHWLPSNTPNLTSVVNAVTAQLTELGGVITDTVVDFATVQVDQFYAAQVQVSPGGTLGVTSLDTPLPGQTLAIGPVNAGQITLGTSGPSTVTLSAGSHIGIGTTAPKNSLSIDGALEFLNSAFNGTGTGIWRPAVNQIGFVTSGATQVRIDSTGRVGIGIAGPQSKLDVNGNIRTAQLTALPTNGGTVATDASTGNSMTVIAGAGVASFTVAAPTNPATGQFFTYIFENASGGALTTNFNAVFKLAGAWTSAATGNERGVTFLYDGTSWREVSRNAADVPL